MKEATGELNMTVIVAIAVGILAAFFYTIIWPSLKANFNSNARCAKAVCYCKIKGQGNVCRSQGIAKCHIKGDNSNTFNCPWKG